MKEKQHSERWFERQEALLRRPFKNTQLYYYIPSFAFIAVYLLTKDYYHGWQSFLLSFLNLSIFWTARLEWAYLWDILFWALGFAAQIFMLAFMVKSLRNITLCKYYMAVTASQSSDYLSSARAVTATGPPGSGKTFSLGPNFAIVLAMQRWDALQNDYFLGISLEKYWIQSCDTDKLKRFQALKEAYLFYAEREDRYIPCLVSSIPLRDLSGRFSYILSEEIFEQTRRLPEYTILFNDESGLDSGTGTSKSATPKKKAFFRFLRHFADLLMLNTDQRESGNGNYIRASTDYNTNLQRQRTLMRPKFGEKLLAKAKNRYFKRFLEGKYTESRAQYLGEKYFYLEKILETIGFREVPYTLGGANGQPGNYGSGKYIFPRRGYGDYDNRTWSDLYEAKDLPLNLPAWDSLVVDRQDVQLA